MIPDMPDLELFASLVGLKYRIHESFGISFQMQVKRELVNKLIGFRILYFQNQTK